jgi:hypothetical protein
MIYEETALERKRLRGNGMGGPVTAAGCILGSLPDAWR